MYCKRRPFTKGPLIPETPALSQGSYLFHSCHVEPSFDSEHFARPFTPHRWSYSHLSDYLHNGSLLYTRYKCPSAPILDWCLYDGFHGLEVDFAHPLTFYREIQVQVIFVLLILKRWSSDRPKSIRFQIRDFWQDDCAHLLSYPIFSEVSLEHLKLWSPETVLISWVSSTWATIWFCLYIQPSKRNPMFQSPDVIQSRPSKWMKFISSFSQDI